MVMKELDEFEPGCVSAIVGGYAEPIPSSSETLKLSSLSPQLPPRKAGE